MSDRLNFSANICMNTSGLACNDVTASTNIDPAACKRAQHTSRRHSSYLIDDGLRVLFSHTYLGLPSKRMDFRKHVRRRLASRKQQSMLVNSFYC